jgi:hypothetical protein
LHGGSRVTGKLPRRRNTWTFAVSFCLLEDNEFSLMQNVRVN